MTRYFLDANVFLRHLLDDDPTRSPVAHALFRAVEQGRVDAWTSDLVIAELVFVLSSKRTYSVPPRQIANTLLPLLALPHLKLRNKLLHHTAFALYTSRGIDYIDAYNAALMRQSKRTDIFTFDTDFDDLPGITRHETL